MQSCIKNDDKIRQNRRKWLQNQPKWSLGELWTRNLEALAFGGRILSHVLCYFFSFLAPIGRFWMPFWIQLGAKGLPKSSILGQSRQQIEKNEIKERVFKTHEIIIDT